jgi:penicillin-binding protein 1A
MTRAFLAAFAIVSTMAIGPARAAEPTHFWDLQPKSLRLLVASSQIMAKRTESGWDAYCRCPVILTPAEIPDVMKKAIVAVEDKRYFNHGGVDVVALLSVLRGGLSRGGSTIPMQLLKNLVLHDLRGRGALATLERKGAEVWYAGLFDEAVGKEELLAAYLNQIEFGGREIVGLYRASRHYFRKEPKDLTLYEAATLAGMVQAPARFNPLKEQTRERAHERTLLVWKLMAEQGRITQAERRRAAAAGARPGMLPEFRLQPQAFTEWIVQNWGERYVKPGETVRFFVTLNPKLQHVAEQQLADLRRRGGIPQAYDAGAVMMASNGRIQAMVGSVDWSKRQFNNAVKGRMQAGSTAKLPLVIAACEAGLTPESLVVDRPIRGHWPANGSAGYSGRTTLKEAIASSRNAAAVRLVDELGVEKVAQAGLRIGIDPGPVDDPAFILGSYSTSVLTMTSAYAAVAAGGYRVNPTGILAVVDGRGQVRADFLSVYRKRVISERCVEQTRLILGEVVRNGTGRTARLRNGASYGKTGTSTGHADAWFVGWSEDRVLGIWMGRSHDATGPGLAGAGAPAAYFGRVLEAANAWSSHVKAAETRRLAAARQPSRTENKLSKWFDALAQSMEAMTSPIEPPARSAGGTQIPLPPERPEREPAERWSQTPLRPRS